MALYLGPFNEVHYNGDKSQVRMIWEENTKDWYQKCLTRREIHKLVLA